MTLGLFWSHLAVRKHGEDMSVHVRLINDWLSSLRLTRLGAATRLGGLRWNHTLVNHNYSAQNM